ncbi:response regulator NasT [Endobacter medicaginis]|uniref:ANTAR domain-containing protein n=1 Tax=Endobacter medicaginis TaxID=1181271 RepID=A0A850NV69_9PROT|nr:ANTAR domain-containing protein [Endobacter medicaginis]MBB3174475.1 response regulator NasT [Endobacter medicaginis]MCX5475076.1 ANTAR domain-containing protein [Endobacter medicaginis]NVN31385.1 ANTAR domain-containing protein [Endobacter medicaginis]
MKVLLADENRRRVQALFEVLHADPALTVFRLESGMALIEAVSLHAPDVVLVDIARPDRDALDSVRALASTSQASPIALLVDEDDPELMEAAFEAGVCSYNVLTTPLTDAKPLLRAAIALYARFRRTEEELRRAQQLLADRMALDRAKRLLMQTDRLDEAQAHRLLQRRAMREQRRLPDIARDILRAHDKDTAR